MLLPPTNIRELKIASFTPSEMNVHRLSGGRGLIVDTDSGRVAWIMEEDGSTRILSGDQINRDYTVSEAGAAEVSDLMEALRLPEETNLDPETALQVAQELLVGYRWRAAESLEHDLTDRRTYLLDALADPIGFLHTVEAVDAKVEEKMEEEVEHAVDDMKDHLEDKMSDDIIEMSSEMNLNDDKQHSM